MRFLNFGLVLALIILSHCGDEHILSTALNPVDTACQPRVAQIAVADGFLENLCGCQEALGTLQMAPANITCTVTAGTTVIFRFAANQQRHQIISTTIGAFAASNVSDPTSPFGPKIYPVQFTTV